MSKRSAPIVGDDFFLYSTVTGLVFAKLFFPQSDPLVGTLEAFAIYAVGFVARPIGAAIFGHYGDRIGRKATLIATLTQLSLLEEVNSVLLSDCLKDASQIKGRGC